MPLVPGWGWCVSGCLEGRVGLLRIGVTGASGRVGGRVARLLAGEHEVVALSRDPRRAAAQGVAGRAVGADLADRRGLERALAGVDALLAVTFDPLEPAHDANLLAAAQACGVRHVVKLSALAVTDAGADDVITSWQRECEERVRATGMTWTLVRPRAFMSNVLDWAPSVRQDSVVRSLFGSSGNACIDPWDVAEVAARALIDPGHEGRVHALTGPQTLTPRCQTRQLAEVLGRPVRFEELTEAAALERWRSRYPEGLACALLASAVRQREGAKVQRTDEVCKVTGRMPRTFTSWVAGHAALFGAGAVSGPGGAVGSSSAKAAAR